MFVSLNLFLLFVVCCVGVPLKFVCCFTEIHASTNATNAALISRQTHTNLATDMGVSLAKQFCAKWRSRCHVYVLLSCLWLYVVPLVLSLT